MPVTKNIFIWKNRKIRIIHLLCVWNYIIGKYLYSFIPFLGAFPLSDISLMTDEERELYLPAIKAFIKVLESDNLTQDEIDELVTEGEKLQVNFIQKRIWNFPPKGKCILSFDQNMWRQKK